MKKFMIEREIPGIGKASVADVRNAASTSNDALAKLAPDIQWVESYITGERTFCVYLAKDEETIHEHSRLSGIPVSKVTEVHRVIDPLTGQKA